MILKCVATGSKDGNTYLLQSADGRYIILDCGARYGAIEKACDYRVDLIDFALCSHIHSDHSDTIPQLLRHGIDVYTNHEVRERFKGCGWACRNHTEVVNGWKFIPFTVPHTHNDGEKCLNFAYMIEKDGERLLYMTDWMYCPYNLSKLKINHFLIAVNYTDPDLEEEPDGNIRHILQGHSSLKTAKEFLRTSMTDACRTIIACHLSQRNADEDQILTELRELAPNAEVAIAKKGMRIDL